MKQPTLPVGGIDRYGRTARRALFLSGMGRVAWTALHGSEPVACESTHFTDGVEARIGHLVRLGADTDRFDRIEFAGMGRQACMKSIRSNSSCMATRSGSMATRTLPARKN